jgi:hypothetical protein
MFFQRKRDLNVFSSPSMSGAYHDMPQQGCEISLRGLASLLTFARNNIKVIQGKEKDSESGLCFSSRESFIFFFHLDQFWTRTQEKTRLVCLEF